jgi:proline iminopeptidase
MNVRVDGAELFYSSRGTGRACLVPTAMGTRLYEQQMPPRVSEGRRLVFVDLRGGGQSTGDPHALTFDQVAADFEAVRVDLGEDEVSVIGHSILGALAIEYGRRCPDTVSHVITVGTPPRGDMGWLFARATQFFEQDASEERKAAWRDNLAKLAPGTPLEQSFPAQAPLRFFNAHTDMVALYRDAQVKPGLLAHLMGSLTSDWDITRDASSLRVPILLAHGRYDYTVPCTLWDNIETVLPTATRHVFQRSGHQPFFEEPDEFATVVAAWMKRQDDTLVRAV